MARVRRDVWSEGPGWSPSLKLYAKAVRVLQARKLDDPTSWRFLGAMHGIWDQLWTDFGIVGPGDAFPKPAVQQAYWNQCQHQSWYFLPWHRGYLWAFESILRAALGAEGNDWALPYWNYNGKRPRSAELHPAFRAEKMDDGSDNPLFVKRRYGKTVLTAADVPTSAL